MKKIVWLITSCLMVLSLVIASCGQQTEGDKVIEENDPDEVVITETVSQEDEEETEEEQVDFLSPEQPKYGGIYTTILNSDPTGWDPGHARLMKSTGHTGEELIGGNWAMGPAGTGEYSWQYGFGGNVKFLTGQLAESWEFPDDETIIYNIRKGIRWWDKPPTNGREYTAEDAVWNIKRALTMPGGFFYTAYYPGSGFQPTSVKAIDKYTVELKLSPQVQALMFLAIGEYIWHLSPDVVEEYGDMKDWQNFCGTGPYIITDYVTGSSINYERNPAYWQKDPLHSENQLPYPDGRKDLIITDSSTRLASFRTGKVDYLGGLFWEDAEYLLKNNSEIQHKKRFGTYNFLSGRVDKEELPFTNVKVRQALNMAIDKPTILETYYGGNADLLAYPFFPSGVFEGIYTPLEEQSQVVQDMFTYHPDKAKTLLAEAGYPDGFKTEIICRQADVDFLSIIREYFLAVGVDMEIKPLEVGAYMGVLMGKRHQQMIYGGEAPTLAFKMLAVRNDSPWAHSNYEHERTREAYNELSYWVGRDDTKLTQILKEIGPFILEQAVCIWPPVPHEYDMWWPWLQNFYGATGGGGYATANQYLCYIWLDTEMKKSMGY